jgi:hypothetical protein
MSIIKFIGPAIVAGAIATPALAQAVMSEPGYCAQFYPTANCQNKGPGNPYTDPNWRRDGGGWAQSRPRTRPLALYGSDHPGTDRNPEVRSHDCR